MKIRTIAAACLILLTSLGFVVGSAVPATAAACRATYARSTVWTTGYVDGVYVFSPFGVASLSGCGEAVFRVVATPVTGRVASPGGCTAGLPSATDPECYALLGYGGVAEGTLGYPYLTVRSEVLAAGTDGSRVIWSGQCTIAVPAPGEMTSCPYAP